MQIPISKTILKKNDILEVTNVLNQVGWCKAQSKKTRKSMVKFYES